MRLKKNIVEARRAGTRLLQGTAELLEQGPRFRKIQRVLYEKYPQYPEEAALGKGDVIAEITPKHVFSWGLE